MAICLIYVINNKNSLNHVTLQKQPHEVFCKKKCSQEFCKIHKKTPVPESLFYQSCWPAFSRIPATVDQLFLEYLHLWINFFKNAQICKTTRSSHRSCAIKNGVLKNFTKFTRKHLCQSLFFNEFARLTPATLLKKRLQGQIQGAGAPGARAHSNFSQKKNFPQAKKYDINKIYQIKLRLTIAETKNTFRAFRFFHKHY